MPGDARWSRRRTPARLTVLLLVNTLVCTLGSVGVDALSATPVARDSETTTTTTTSSTATSSTTTTAPTTTTSAPKAPARAPVTVATTPTVPPYGRARMFGCASAVVYLRAYAPAEFSLVCPGPAGGAEALTCYGEAPCAAGQKMIVIADPCPAAYMNEAHNSWVLKHEVEGTPIPDGDPRIDPFGYC